ncbi:MAG TPA: glycosyltransferase [Candidatus Sulfotelmatobacter sp.]|jgi:rhamnosyltransferase
MVQVSILLLTKNGRNDLAQSLPILFAQNIDVSFEVIVVDSGSTDGTLDLVHDFPVQLRQIRSDEFHHARTRNFAASLAQGEIIVFLSQDAIPDSTNWLAAMVANFQDPQVGAVYGRQLPKRDSSLERQDVLHAIYGETRIVKDPAQRGSLGYRFYHFSDVNAAMRHTVWQSARFPEDLKVFEDLGIAKHILDRGWKIVYEPRAAVFHSHVHTTIGLFKRYFDIGYTFRLLRIWEAPGIRKSLLRDGWRLMNQKIKRRAGPKGGRSVGYGIRQDLAKSAGLLLGLNENRLPLILKRRLSAYRVFG